MCHLFIFPILFAEDEDFSILLTALEGLLMLVVGIHKVG